MGEYIGLVPPPEGFVQTEKYNFARFAEGPNYKKVNHDLVEKVYNQLPIRSIGVDVATGHGMVLRQMAEIANGTNKSFYLIGVDLDPYAIERARKQILSTGECGFVFLQGDARNLKDLLKDYFKPGEVDYASIHDAIHEIRDDQTKKEIVDSMAEMLKPGGYFSYNSAFTTEAVGIEWAYWQIVFMKTFNAKRYKGEEIQSMPIHPPAFYRRLIEAAGLSIVHDKLAEVPMSEKALIGISEYPPFARGFTEKLVFDRPVCLDEGIEGIKQAIKPTLDRYKTDSLLRKWHEIIAQKAA